MKTATLSQVETRLSAYIRAAQKSPVVITKRGKPVALLTGLNEDDDLDTLVLAHNPRFMQILGDARARVRRTGGIKSADFWKQVEQRHKSKRK